MQILNSFEIASELRRLGYAVVVRNKHANGYENPAFKERVFLKMSKTGLPVHKQPLLIHPKHLDSPHWEKIRGLSPSAPNASYKNTNMTGFPEVPGSDSKLAVALDVTAVGDLSRLLEWLEAERCPPISMSLADDLKTKRLDELLSEISIGDTERNAIIKARIGQCGYRESLLAYWGGCSVTNCGEHSLLRASHIKPWRVATPQERLDPFNGLLLTPNLDQAFDMGFISFNEDGNILISAGLDADSASALNLKPELRLRQVEPRHRDYLAWHREHLFRK